MNSCLNKIDIKIKDRGLDGNMDMWIDRQIHRQMKELDGPGEIDRQNQKEKLTCIDTEREIDRKANRYIDGQIDK